MNPNDPDVIALSKAIIQRESKGDFNAVGDAGTSHGAAQWQAPTWKAQAKDVLGNPDAPMTPENQKAVLQVTVAKRKAAGLNPAQIAAEWNSGKPDGWENKVGTTTINGQQVHYDVPKYVKDVTDLYHQYKGQSSPPVSGYGAPTANAQVPGYGGYAQSAQPTNVQVPEADNSPMEGGFGQDVQHRIGQVSDAAQTGIQGVGELGHGHIGSGLFHLGSGLLQGAGAVAGGVGDAIGGVLGLIPGVKQAEGVIGKGVGALASTGPGQAVLKAGQDFSTAHPTLSKDVGAVGNIAGLATGGIGGKVAKDAVEEGIVQGARKGVLGSTLENVAKKSAVKQADEILSSNPTKAGVRSAVRGGRLATEGGVSSLVNDPMWVASRDEVARAIVEGKIPKGLVADKAAGIKKAADGMAVDLEKQLGSMEVQPIVHPDEIHGLLEKALTKIGEDPTMVGNAEESAKRILNKFNSFLPHTGDITALDLLKARKRLDTWIGGLSGGSKAFDPAYENAKTIALRAIRQGANDLVAEKAPDVAVKELLRRQSNLYRALEYAVPNVKSELGTTRMGRFAKRHPVLKGLVKTAAMGAAGGLGFKGIEDLIP